MPPLYVGSCQLTKMYCLSRLQQTEPSSKITSYTNSSLAAVTVTGIDLRECSAVINHRSTRCMLTVPHLAYFLPLVLRAARSPA